MKTLGDVLTLSAKYLSDHKVERSRRTAEEALSHLLSVKRIDLYMQFDRPMQENELASFREILKKIVAGNPLAHILGKVPFFHTEILVTPDVLIPRPETEFLVERACKLIGTSELLGKQAWDLCTGSGCIGISLKRALPALKVSLSDISQTALDIAKKNCNHNQVDVELLLGDLFAPFGSRKANFVFCNPPYVSDEEYEQLDKSVKHYEPRLALVGGKQGLDFYKRLSIELPKYLVEGGRVFLEIGAGQASSVLDLFCQPYWKTKIIEKDLSLRDRFFFLEIE